MCWWCSWWSARGCQGCCGCELWLWGCDFGWCRRLRITMVTSALSVTGGKGRRQKWVMLPCGVVISAGAGNWRSPWLHQLYLLWRRWWSEDVLCRQCGHRQHLERLHHRWTRSQGYVLFAFGTCVRPVTCVCLLVGGNVLNLNFCWYI